MTQPRNLGEALAAALETGPSRSALAAQRGQILTALANPEPPARPYWLAGDSGQGSSGSAAPPGPINPRWASANLGSANGSDVLPSHPSAPSEVANAMAR